MKLKVRAFPIPKPGRSEMMMAANVIGPAGVRIVEGRDEFYVLTDTDEDSEWIVWNVAVGEEVEHVGYIPGVLGAWYPGGLPRFPRMLLAAMVKKEDGE